MVMGLNFKKYLTIKPYLSGINSIILPDKDNYEREFHFSHCYKQKKENKHTKPIKEKPNIPEEISDIIGNDYKNKG
jgi:hypothetical protein